MEKLARQRKKLEGTESTEAKRKWKRDFMCEGVVRKMIGGSRKDFNKMSYRERLIEMGGAYGSLEEQDNDVFDAINALIPAIEEFEARMTKYKLA